MGDLTLPLSRLLLDELNPRHRPVTTQEAALAEILRRDPRKLLALTLDIAAVGLSPIDRPIVMADEDGKRYVVLEGNRRLAALRLLKKPEICPDASLRVKFREASELAEHRPNRVRCYEVASREEARPLLERRHAGELGGVGVIRWTALQRTRNTSAPGHQERVALATLNWLDARSAVGANQWLTGLIDAIEDVFTTFGRLVGDPDFRRYCGFEIRGDIFSVTDTSENVLLRLTLVLEDFAREHNPLSVTQLDSKDLRAEYIASLRTRMSGADEVDEEDVDLSGGKDGGGDEPADDPSGDGGADQGERDEDDAGGGDGDGDGEPDPPPPMRLFHDASLTQCSVRVRNILNEVQKLPISRYPNAAAACIRMVIELAVHEAHEKCSWPAPHERDPKLRNYVHNALRQLDPTMKAARYLALRQELNKRDSIINTVTLNAFLHDPNYMPSAPAMRTISDTYSVFLTDLNHAIRDAKGPNA